MKKFRYISIGENGAVYREEYHCNNEKELIAYLYSKNQHLVEVKKNIGNIEFGFRKKLKLKELSFFCRQIGTMLDAGIPILETIRICSFQLKKGGIYNNCIHILTSLRKGITLYEAMKTAPSFFPDFMIHMVKIGEESGKLADIFNDLSKYYYKESKLRGKVAGASAYPISVLVFTILIAIVLLTTVVPSMVNMIISMGGEIPLITKIVMNISIFLKANLFYVIVSMLLIVLILAYSIKKGHLNISRIKRRIPLLSRLYCKRDNYEFLYGVYLLLSGGSTLVDALSGAAQILKDTQTKIQINKSAAQIREGGSILTSMMNIEVIDYASLSIIKLGEESGKLSEMLDRLILILEEELTTLLEKFLELIQPVAVIMVGVVVGTIVISIALPMFSMYNIQ